MCHGSFVFFDDRLAFKFSHQLDSDHNMRMLKLHELESLNLTQLRTLLLQNDNWLLPSVSLTSTTAGFLIHIVASDASVHRRGHRF